MSSQIEALLAEKSGIQLDVACGANKTPGFVGMDYQDLPGVDIIHDLAVLPWPLPDDSVIRAIASHYVEHIPKVVYYQGNDGKFHSYLPFISFMNEMWRVMKPGGEFAIAAPHGYSPGFLQDPTHTAGLNEATWYYFNPEHPFYGFYKPKPWKTKFINWDYAANIEVVLIKVEEQNVKS